MSDHLIEGFCWFSFCTWMNCKMDFIRPNTEFDSSNLPVSKWWKMNWRLIVNCYRVSYALPGYCFFFFCLVSSLYYVQWDDDFSLLLSWFLTAYNSECTRIQKKRNQTKETFFLNFEFPIGIININVNFQWFRCDHSKDCSQWLENNISKIFPKKKNCHRLKTNIFIISLFFMCDI